MKPRAWAAGVAPLFVIACAVALIGGWTHGFRAFTNFSIALLEAGPIPRPAPALPVIDERGSQWDVAAPSDRYRLVQAMYLRCPDGCPIAMSNLARVSVLLKDLIPSKLQVISLSVDHDPPEQLAAMWRAHGAHEGWSMASLVGPDSDATMARLSVWIFRRKDGLINHGLDAFLLDPSGKIVRIYSPDMRPVDMAAELRELTAALPSEARAELEPGARP